MSNYKLSPDSYYQMHGGSGGVHCRRCNEVLKGKTVELYINIVEGTWHTTPQPDDNGDLDESTESFGTACAKAALRGE